MGKISRAVVVTSRLCMLLPIAVAGCAQVLGIDDWSEQGGTGGTVSSSSSSGGPGGQGATASSSAGTGGQGGQGPVSSSSAGTGGQGGQGPVSSSSAGTGGQGGQGPVSSSSAGTGGQGGSGGAVGVDEVCDNGVDDDLDGHTDCADTECTMVGYRCAKVFPSPWKGPAILHVSDPSTPLPSCGEGWTNPTDHLAGTLITDPVQCGGCSCGQPTGTACALGVGVGANVYNNTGCTLPALAFSPVSQPNTCTLVNNPTMLGSFYSAGLAGQATLPAGSCQVISGIPTIPPAYFTKHARMCDRATMATGCATNYTCAAPVPPEFNDRVCIYQTLDDNTPPPFCPMPYGQETMLSKSILDQRSCTPCQCTGLCDTSISFFSDPTCDSAGLLLSDLTPGQCGLLQNDSKPLAASIEVGGATSCMPSGAVPQGTVKGVGRTQVCCTL
jgi:hypothetical protein